MGLDQTHIRTAIDLCVATLDRYHASGRGTWQVEVATAELETLFAWAVELKVPPADVEALVLRPVEHALFGRYGHEVAPRLFALCLKSFEDVCAEADAYGRC